MPLTGRTAKDCYEPFRAHVAKLLARTIAPNAVVRVTESGARDRYMLGLAPPGSMLPLDTNHGPLHLHIAQTLEAERDGKRYRLRTRAYWYRLHSAPDVKGRALLRWEYDSDKTDVRRPHPPRNHMHAAATIGSGQANPLDLNRLHLPTGWVLLESVIRFLITDLGVAPVCGDEWPSVLAEGERSFREEFTR